MNEAGAALTVYFDGQFWDGLFERRDAEEQRRYELKQQKRKEKHRGR